MTPPRTRTATGVPDGVEQDRGRPVPVEPGALHQDRRKRHPRELFGWLPRWRLGARVPRCDYGTPNAAIRIALFGDSDAAEWLPRALIKLANQRGWSDREPDA